MNVPLVLLVLVSTDKGDKAFNLWHKVFKQTPIVTPSLTSHVYRVSHVFPLARMAAARFL
jgi:hypothetical protein